MICSWSFKFDQNYIYIYRWTRVKLENLIFLYNSAFRYICISSKVRWIKFLHNLIFRSKKCSCTCVFRKINFSNYKQKSIFIVSVQTILIIISMLKIIMSVIISKHYKLLIVFLCSSIFVNIKFINIAG